MDLHGPGYGLAVCRPYPTEGARTPEQIRAGTVKLRRYVKELGFRRVGESPFYGLSMSRRAPRYEDLLRPGN